MGDSNDRLISKIALGTRAQKREVLRDERHALHSREDPESVSHPTPLRRNQRERADERHQKRSGGWNPVQHLNGSEAICRNPTDCPREKAQTCEREDGPRENIQ